MPHRWARAALKKESSYENSLDPGYLDHPFEVGGEDSVLDEPAGELVPLGRVAAVDGQTRLSILVLGVLQVTGYFLVHTEIMEIISLPNPAVNLVCFSSIHFTVTLMMVAKYSPPMWFSVFMYRSRSSLAPTGLYLALNLSKRWKVCLPFRETTIRQERRFRSSEVENGNWIDLFLIIT